MDELISPLRFDITVRIDYFHYLAGNLELWHRDRAEFARRARDLPYFVWFREVAWQRHHVGGPDSGIKLLRAFDRRLERSAELYLQFQRDGFDFDHPITVRTAGTILPTGTNKVLARRFYPTDGCHRLALLAIAGHRTLAPSFYRVRVDRAFAPRDNTLPLLCALRLTPAEYYAFLARGYTQTAHTERDALLADLAASQPEALAELTQIMAVDQFLALRS